MNLRYLVLQEEERREKSFTLFTTFLDQRIQDYLHENPLYYDYEDHIRRLFFFGLASRTLGELRSISSNIFVITNDFPEGTPMPWDRDVTGNISEDILRKHNWLTVRAGLGEEKVFERNLRFDNHVFQLNGGDYTDFIEAFLDIHMHPISYWFTFAKEETKISGIADSISASSNEVEFTANLCKTCLVVVHGLEEYVYVFETSDSAVAELLRESFRSNPRTK